MVRLEELSKWTLDAPVPDVTIRELLFRKLFDEMNFPIDVEVEWTVGAANSQTFREYRISHDVPIMVGGITARGRLVLLEKLC